ncbi:hypothetical protein [Phocaeicola plebeius]|jgi:hypothetical protein|uniref:hypothetical protein n=2 Tax=Phocaeicola plebeius TaxID=310297 RepID=UPI0022E40C1F|nr:hypothetical protein [Phocaeicola plebeius]
MEKVNDFKAFSFYERFDDQYLEYLFESAWDTLSKLYPDYSLDAADCFVIEMYTKEMLYSDDYEDLIIQFNLGVCCGMPALQNSMTKEVIPIKLNEKRWYNPEDNYIIRFDPWLGYKQ